MYVMILTAPLIKIGRICELTLTGELCGTIGLNPYEAYGSGYAEVFISFPVGELGKLPTMMDILQEKIPEIKTAMYMEFEHDMAFKKFFIRHAQDLQKKDAKYLH